MYVHVFTADGIEGTPEATEEAVPEWHDADDLPYDEMWVDDRVWMPHMLQGQSFTGTFVLTDEGDAMHRYEMELGVAFE
jgi:8-oxo-dGTP diphosphatase